MTGVPHIPPYWALGFHLSRYGYNNMESIINAINRTVTAEIPFVSWHLFSAIHLMLKGKCFQTIDLLISLKYYYTSIRMYSMWT